MAWGVVITLVAALITFVYLRSITIDDGLEALIFFPTTFVLFLIAGAVGGWKGRTMMWTIGVSVGSGALLVVGETILLISILRNRSSSWGDHFGSDAEVTLITVIGGISTVGMLIGYSFIAGIVGWLPANRLRRRQLDRRPPPPAESSVS